MVSVGLSQVSSIAFDSQPGNLNRKIVSADNKPNKKQRVTQLLSSSAAICTGTSASAACDSLSGAAQSLSFNLIPCTSGVDLSGPLRDTSWGLEVPVHNVDTSHSRGTKNQPISSEIGWFSVFDQNQPISIEIGWFSGSSPDPLHL